MSLKSKYKSIIVVVATVVSSIICMDTAAAQEMHYSYYPSDDLPKVRIEWGLGLGGSYTGIQRVSTPYVSLSPRLGIAGHLDMAVCFGKYFAIESEIIYEGASIMAATKSVDRRIKTRTVDIPVLLSLRLLNSRIRVNAGPLFTVMSSAEYTEGGNAMFYGPVHPTWNIAAGIGVGLTRHFILEARYVYALKDSINQFGGFDFTTRTYRVTAGVTLLF
ncbi:MAG: PorT family protein [Alistipes sp.]|nr:PorT family protein [Alistipes sp.]